MQIRDVKAGDNIEVVKLAVKNVGQGKFGKPPGNTPYQHLWLTDGTGDIRFSLFGEDVNKIQQGQTVEIIDAYVKEYPAGSGKLQLSLSRDHGAWQIVSGDGPPVRSEDITPAPVQIVSSDTRDRNINRQSARRDAVAFLAGTDATFEHVLDIACEFYEWAMGEAPEKPPEPKSAEEPKDSPDPAPKSPEEPNWSWFWMALKKQGYGSDDVHKVKGFESVKGWLKDNSNKTLTDALNEILSQLKSTQ